jgi:DNA-binding NarL/FixJ family response regulator
MIGPAISVAMLDDNTLATEAVERWLQRMPSLEWRGWTDRADGISELFENGPPDVLLLDFDLPGCDTVTLIHSLRKAFPDVQIVVLSGHVQPECIKRAIEAGARGYLCKDERVVDIVEYVRRAAAGERVLSEAARKVLFGSSEL